MKSFSSGIPGYMKERLLERPIRSQIDYIHLIVEVTECLLGGNPCIHDKPYVHVVIDKMARLFVFYNSNKYASVFYPFHIEEREEASVSIYNRKGEEISYKELSAVREILNDNSVKQNRWISFSDLWYDYITEEEPFRSSEQQEIGVTLIEEILQYEPAYVRYDHDPQNANGNLHPRYHIDINYSQGGTFKLGLQNLMTQDQFKDLHDLKTDCLYLNL
ncbi:hypothetical protein [Porphyromonas gulae]|uniref:hypothetical protein n=1 Tax=Porphyromonas gulae TaxID=111105 RepID=UPI00068A898D|nr:hypothetical protein [Porphyromonas gulae]